MVISRPSEWYACPLDTLDDSINAGLLPACPRRPSITACTETARRKRGAIKRTRR